MPNYEFDDDEPFVVIEKQTGSAGAFLIGAAIGAGIALLFAPRSGVETRMEIQRSARRVRDRAADWVEPPPDRSPDTSTDAGARGAPPIDRARQAVDMKRQQVSRAMEAGRAAAHQARADLERRISETKAAYQAGADVARNGPSRGGALGVSPASGDTIGADDDDLT